MSKARILIVEDEAIVAADLQNKLRQLGYEVAGTAATGEDAVKLAARESPELVLMDIRLGGQMDGIETSQAMRKNAEVPVVFLTAHSDAATLARAGQAEAFGYILKPFEDRELRTQIEMALYKHAAEQALREADRRKTEFIALLSHELRNPLSAIRNSAQLLDRAVLGNPQAQQCLAIIGRQVNQLVRLVDDLLDVTRITQNKIQLQLTQLELNELIRRTAEDNLALWQRNQVAVETSFAEAPLYVKGDSARLSQVLGNLLHNAVKFTRSGGTIRISICEDRATRQAAIRIADTGVGIDPALLSTLFQPFVQADRTLARSQGGLGLGLAVVKGLVECHGGTVSAASAGVGKGAEFTVRLPLVAPPPVEKSAPSVHRAPSGQHLLIIDDNHDVADTLRATLSFMGHAVEVAYDGPAGLEKARQRKPDVVLCDIGLPGMDGYAVAKAFRADAALCSTYLVAISGYAQPEDVARAHAAGFNEHLAKPFDPLKLTELLAYA